jgi:hypothetical protein
MRLRKGLLLALALTAFTSGCCGWGWRCGGYGGGERRGGWGWHHDR